MPPEPVQFTFIGPVTINEIDPVALAAPFLAALAATQGVIVTALSDLQAANVRLDSEVADLVTEQAQFLLNVAAALDAAGTDPAALAAVSADLNAQADALQALADAQAAADPAK